jgi:hypothetical protein
MTMCLRLAFFDEPTVVPRVLPSKRNMAGCLLGTTCFGLSFTALHPDAVRYLRP